MDFLFSEEQSALRDTLQRYLARDYGFERRREIAASESGFSREVWARLAEFGVLAMPLPEDCEGFGGSGVDVMVVMEALGAALVVEPYVPAVVLAGGLIAEGGSAAQRAEILPRLGRGELLLSLAHHEAGARYALEHVGTRAQRSGDGWSLSGAKAVVLHGAAADRLVVSARSAGADADATGISLFLVDRDAPGVSLRSYRTQDGARAAEVKLENVRVGPQALIGTAGEGLALVEHAIDRGIAALCAEAVGIMAALNDATLEYLKTRKQFGVPIGKFQALQHRMVDMVVALEQARSMSELAAVRADSGERAERRRAISAAKALVGQSARFVGQQAVQLHGGMGVTDELIVSHWFKRLTMINALFGDADHHLGRFSDLLLAEA